MERKRDRLDSGQVTYLCTLIPEVCRAWQVQHLGSQLHVHQGVIQTEKVEPFVQRHLHNVSAGLADK